MATDVRDVLASQIEYVNKNIQHMYEEGSQVCDLVLQNLPAHTINRRLGRLIVQQYRGGNWGKMSANGTGNYGQGTGNKQYELKFGAFYAKRNFRFNDEVRDTTQGNPQAVVDIVAEQIGGAMADCLIDDDVAFHQSGTGVISSPTSLPAATGAGTASTTITFAGATDYWGISMFRQGMCIEFWSQDLTTKRTTYADATLPLIIEDIDYANKAIKLNQAVTINPAGSQDVAVIPDMDAYGPSTLTIGSSTWPDNTVAGGLSGDTFRHGMDYALSVNTSDYYLGQLKSSKLQLLSNRVNASTASLSWSHGRQLDDQILTRSSDDKPDHIGLASLAQVKAIEDLGVNLTEYRLQGGGLQTPADLIAYDRKYGTPVQYCGKAIYRDKRLKKDRINYLDKTTWFRAQFFERGFLDGGDSGKYLFRGRIPSTARLATWLEFIIRDCFDFVCSSPMRNGYIDSLAVEAAYV